MILKNKIPKHWRSWINSNLKRGVSKDYIFNTLLENDFSYEAAKKEMQYEAKIEHIIPASWKAWLQENISLGKNKDDLFKVLMMNGFSYDSIKNEMKYAPKVPIEKLNDPFNGSYGVNHTNSLHKSISSLNDNAVRLASDKLEIFMVRSFLSDIECDYLAKLISDNLRPSELARPDTDKRFRTSSTCDLSKFNNKIVKTIDARICSLVGVEAKLSEPIQGQFYEIGQEFKSHTDFFEEAELEKHAGSLGQRTFTVMIYLNTTSKGGETYFPRIDKKFNPEKGKAIIWSNLNSDYTPNHYSLHQAREVQLGSKAIITKWFRTGMPNA